MNKYTIQHILGEGAFGKVVLAQNRANGENVAIKEIKKAFRSWDECLKLRELKSLQRLRHDNIVVLKEVIREKGLLCFVFEYLPTNLYNIIAEAKNTMQEHQIQHIMLQLLKGLGYMHKHGYFHRDIKPDNILSDGELYKIADFGLAREIRSRPPYTDYVSTRWYRAPEVVLRSGVYSSPVDIWACGCIMAELYTGKPLFPGKNMVDQMRCICSILGSPTSTTWQDGIRLAGKINFQFPHIGHGHPSLCSRIPNACEESLNLIAWMLQLDPAKRPTCSQAISHPFFSKNFSSYEAKMSKIFPNSPKLEGKPTPVDVRPMAEAREAKSTYNAQFQYEAGLRKSALTNITDKVFEFSWDLDQILGDETGTRHAERDDVTQHAKVALYDTANDARAKKAITEPQVIATFTDPDSQCLDCKWDEDDDDTYSSTPKLNGISIERSNSKVEQSLDCSWDIEDQQEEHCSASNGRSNANYPPADAPTHTSTHLDSEMEHVAKGNESLLSPVNLKAQLYLQMLQEKELLEVSVEVARKSPHVWTSNDCKALCKAFYATRGMDKQTRWKHVQKAVGNGVSKRECFDQYKKMREKRRARNVQTGDRWVLDGQYTSTSLLFVSTPDNDSVRRIEPENAGECDVNIVDISDGDI